MKYAVSACLCGINCKYNGGNNYHARLCEFLKDHTVITVCPECAGGLPVPRVCCEIRGGRVIDKEGKDVTEAFERGAQAELEKIIKNGSEAVILQPRSPSCGKGIIYDGTFTGTRICGDGIFVQKLREAGIPCQTVDEFFGGSPQEIHGKSVL